MNRALLVDDHLLLRIILDDEPADLRPHGGRIATTGLWYHRLCRALAGDALVGSMSRQLAGLEARVVTGVIAKVIELPESIQLVSLRTLAWPMGELVHAGASLNLLSLEALAAARHLDAEICLAPADDNAPLRAVAAGLAIPVRLVATTST